MTQAAEATKKCPFCAETIRAEAVVCRFCGRDLARLDVPVLQAAPISVPAPAVPTRPKQNGLRYLVIGVLLGVPLTCVACFTVVMLTPSSPATIATRTARVLATEAVAALVETRTPAVATPTVGPSPSPVDTATPAPTIDRALGLSLSEFAFHYDHLTDLQREQFLADLPGKTVDWTGTVYDVDERGIHIDMPGSVWNGFATLRDVPPEVAITINKNSRIHFTATVDDTVQFVFFYIYLVDVEVFGD